MKHTRNTGLAKRVYTNFFPFLFVFLCYAGNVQADFNPLDLNGNGIADKDEAEVVVNSNVALPAGEYFFNNLVISNNSVLTAEGDPDSENLFKGVKINANNLTVTAGSAISADGEGYVPGSSPGSSIYPQAGASYGGVGGSGGMNTYGSATHPTDLGSGSPYVGRGGGAIWLQVSGTLINDGLVSANGDGSSSGGSVYVISGNLVGAGTFEAKGGSYTSSSIYHGLGGGGRIAIYYRASPFSGLSSASGGCGSLGMGYPYNCAGHGTVGFFDMESNSFISGASWRFQQNDSPFDLNNIVLYGNSLVEIEDGASVSANNMTITGTSSLTISGSPEFSIHTILVNNNSTMILSEKKLTAESLAIMGNSMVTVAPEKILSLEIENITVDFGSSISADGKGYGGVAGPGAPDADHFQAGASYGGVGYHNTPESVYGSEREPTDFGSGGQGYQNRGGGAIRIVSTGLFLNNGVISADGDNTSSGGSIYVTAKNLAGGGKFNAEGGTNYCPNICFGSGGGGRIAVYYENSTFAGEAEAMAGMFCFYGCSGQGTTDGTVIMEQVTPTFPACTTDCFSNVLFLPGLEASRLNKLDSNGGTEYLWEPTGNDSATRKLFMDDNGNAIRDDIYTSSVIDNAYVPFKGNVYSSFLEQLDTMKNTEKMIADYSVIPYDWRLSFDDILNNGAEYSDGRLYYSGPLSATSTPYIIQELRRLAHNSRTGKVTIIAHSNGGLLTKALTNKLGDEASELIDKIIFVAVPQAGTPQAVGAILHGFEQSLPIKPLSWFGILESTARDLAKNMPSAYNLLPSENYFTYVDEVLISFDNDPLLASWREKYGVTIHSAETLHNFLVDQSRTTMPVTVGTKSPAIGNELLLGKSESVHDVLDKWTSPEGISLTEIAGWGEETLSTIVYYQGTKTTCDVPNDIYTCRDAPALEYSPKLVIDGDGTVVVPSALWTAEGTDVKKYWVDLDKYNEFLTIKREHADILEIPQLRIFIEDIITDKKLGNLSSYQHISTSSPINTNVNKKRLHFTLHSPLSLDLYDSQGNHTGFSTTTNSLEENIPDSRFLTFGEVSLISVPSSVGLQLIMEGYSNGSFSLDIEEVQDDEILASTTFSGIPSFDGTKVTMDIAQDQDIGNLLLNVDYNGDGTTDKSLKATPGGTTTFDNIPPEISISFDALAKEVTFSGKDDSPVTVEHSSASTTALDSQDNKSILYYTRYKEKPTKLKLSFNTIIRNGVSTAFPNTNIQYNWTEKKGVLTDLDTKVVIKGEERYIFSYKKAKNTTIIKEKTKSGIKTTSKQGFVVVTVTTKGDEVKIDY